MGSSKDFPSRSHSCERVHTKSEESMPDDVLEYLEETNLGTKTADQSL